MTRQPGRNIFDPLQSRRRAGCSGAESENGFVIHAEVWFCLSGLLFGGVHCVGIGI